MDALNYILFKNPVVTNSWSLLKSIGYYLPTGEESVVSRSASTLVPKLSSKEVIQELLIMNRNYIRFAGIFGASAVILGAYGAHSLLAKVDEKDKTLDHRKKVFQTASQYHFYHLIAFLAAPFCRFPKITAITTAFGLIIFCGSCYYQSITGDETPKPITPYGGSLLIIAWLTMLL